MITLLFQVNIPIIDGTSTYTDASSISSAMEGIALDGYTRQELGNYVVQNGILIGQCRKFYWFIDDGNLSTAIANFTTFKSSYTWGGADPESGMNAAPNYVVSQPYTNG